MEILKKTLGVIWLILGPVAILYMIYRANYEMSTVSESQAVETNLFWIIVITIFIPIAIGFVVFGWYALKGEYQDEY